LGRTESQCSRPRTGRVTKRAGLLYSDTGDVSPSGQLFDGLSGDESNPDTNGSPVALRPIDGSGPVDYFMPGTDPGEGYARR
jgi:phospholipase C